jgi:hypothetical protein
MILLPLKLNNTNYPIVDVSEKLNQFKRHLDNEKAISNLWKKYIESV